MKKLQFQVLFLVVILISSLIRVSFNTINDDEQMELCENSSEEEQENEKETEEEIETSVEFILQSNFSALSLSLKNTYYVSKKETFTTINTDVLTPPPEFI